MQRVWQDLGCVALPDDDVLREELAFCRYDVESSPLKLVPKKKLPRSPNRSDALAMPFWEMDYAKLTAKPNLSLCPDPASIPPHEEGG